MIVDEYISLIAEMRADTITHFPNRGLDEFRQPAKPEWVAAAGEELEIAIPDDLTTMLLASDGGWVIPGSAFLSVEPSPNQDHTRNDIQLVEGTLSAKKLLWPHIIFPSRIQYTPQHDFISLTGGDPFGFWYETSGPKAGSILYWDILGIEWGHIVIAAPSLQNLFLAARDSIKLTGEFHHSDATDHVFERYGINPQIYR